MRSVVQWMTSSRAVRVIVATGLVTCARPVSQPETVRSTVMNSGRAAPQRIVAATVATDARPSQLTRAERAAQSCPASIEYSTLEHAAAIAPAWAVPARGTITQCPPSSAAFREAQSAYQSFSTRMDALRPGEDVGPIKLELARMLSHRCFAIGIVDGVMPSGASAHSLRSWWEDGGDAWVRSLLETTAPQSTQRSTRWFAPTERRSLVLEEHRDSPLASVLCPASDTDCGRESATFVLRFERLLAGQAALEAVRETEHTDPPRRSAEDWHAYCERLTNAARPEVRYAAWRTCAIEHLQDRVIALPLGQFRLPSGWLVIEGRRGHYQYCDELEAIHLESGSLYRAKACNALAFVQRFLARDGGVDSGVSPYAIETGRVSPSAIREATLALLLSRYLTEDAKDSVGLELPQGVRVEHTQRGFEGLHGFGSGWFSSNQTRLRWTWFDRGCKRAHGTLIWPSSSDAGNSVAAHLLAVSNSTFDATESPAAPLPRWIVLDAPASGGVSAVDAEPGALRDTRNLLREALREQVAVE